MDYTKIPRELIFYDRLSIDEFNVDDRESFNYEIFEQIMRLFCIDPTKEETESLILKIFNDAYYILTMVFLEKRPVFRINRFQSIAKEDSSYLMLFQKEIIVFSIVRGVLKLYGTILDSNKSFFCDKLDEYLEDRKKSSGSSNCEIIFSNQTIEMSYEHSHFIPRKITEDLARQIDWVTLTNKFNLEEIKDIVNCIGEDSGEKKIIIKAIYDAESATGNMAAIPYDVDKLLDQLYKKYDEKHKGLRDVYDARRESLNLDTLMENKIDEYMKRNAATEKDIDEIFSDTEPLLSQIEDLKDEVNQLAREKAILEQQFKDKESEKGFTATGNECFTKAQMGLLIYTMASMTDGPTPVKAKLVSIISAIGGWEPTSVGTEMKKAGFNQSDIDAVAKLFEVAMPNFASEIKKQIPRRPKSKK